MPSSISLFNSFNFAVVPEEAPSGGENLEKNSFRFILTNIIHEKLDSGEDCIVY